MAVQVSGKTVDIGDALRSHVEATVDALVRKYFGRGYSGHVVLEREGPGYRAEATLHIDAGAFLRTEGSAQEPRFAVERALDRLEKRLRRHHRRLTDHGGGAKAARGEPATAYVIEAPAEDAELAADYRPVVIAEEATALETMTVSEAVLAMDLAGEAALAFRSAGHGGLSVVYRRADGNIGWIDPTFSPAGDSGGR